MHKWKPMMAYRVICWLKPQPAFRGMTVTLLMSAFLWTAIWPVLATTPVKTSKTSAQTSKPVQNTKTDKKSQKIAQNTTKNPDASKTTPTAKISLPTLEPVTDFIESTDSETTAKTASPLNDQTVAPTSAQSIEAPAQFENLTQSSQQSLNGTATKTMDPYHPVSYTPADPKNQSLIKSDSSEKPATLNPSTFPQKSAATPAVLNTSQNPSTSQTAQPSSNSTTRVSPATSLPKKAKSAAKTETLPKQAQKETHHKHEKKSHPLVIAPEPLLPARDWIASKSAQSNNQRTENKAIPAPSSPVAKPTTGPAQLTGRATAAAKPASTTMPATASTNPSTDQKTTTAKATPSDNTKAAISPTNPAQEKKPLPAIAHKSSAINGQPVASTQTHHHHFMERGFYPIGYTPAVRHLTPQKNLALRQALVHYNRGVYYARHKQWDEAISEYINVINEDSNMADAYVGLSTAEMHLKDWENALQNSTKALQLKQGFVDPANITQARYNLSSVYCVTNDYKKALHYFKLIKKARHPETETLWSFLQNNCQP